MTTREIRCEACGTLNRLPDYSIRRIPECGKCHVKLPEARSTAMLRTIHRFRIQIVAVPMVGLLAWAVWDATILGAAKQPSAETAQTAANQSASASTCIKYRLPSHGLYEEDGHVRAPGALDDHNRPWPVLFGEPREGGKQVAGPAIFSLRGAAIERQCSAAAAFMPSARVRARMVPTPRRRIRLTLSPITLLASLVKHFAQQTLEDECEYSETNKEDNIHKIHDEIDS